MSFASFFKVELLRNDSQVSLYSETKKESLNSRLFPSPKVFPTSDALHVGAIIMACLAC